MHKKSKLADDDRALFKEITQGVAPLEQDKIPPQPPASKQKANSLPKKTGGGDLARKIAASFEFSDGFEAWFDPKLAVKYIRPMADHHLLKQLRRGDYVPEFILDLHGLKRDEAKAEIAALLYTAVKQHCDCVCIVHGIGEHVLKRSTPNWLIQHPDVVAFHQAPLEWGGDGALLVLLDISTN
ncbi:endonuclease SmrB [Aliiglaciecola sp. CAU 1673]|uniref:endonuclease SmrB n=1 Tax=Aliiglaciecola sp. CAU 1673 TaxID=3032595 RepID=UPI0023DA7980|nr:endonuclease SmrB [Aliiglaciecola sp. CAU 1673]MDF2178037.1 endonuclease SmrB [Aliiglaciecola sp. CAU 1673]